MSFRRGEVDILAEVDGEEKHIAVRQAGEFIGEMSIFDSDRRSANRSGSRSGPPAHYRQAQFRFQDPSGSFNCIPIG